MFSASLPAAVVAASPAAQGSSAHVTAHTVSAWSLLTQLVIGLAVILAIIFLASRFLTGKSKIRLGAARRQPISVLYRQSMGKGMAVAVIQAGTNTYLLGLTPQQITCLDEIDPATLVAEEAEPEPARSRSVVVKPGQAWRDEPRRGFGAMVRQLQERSVRR